MPWLRHFAGFIVFGAALLRPAAAAFVSVPDASSQARVGGCEVVASMLTGSASAATYELHEGIVAAYDESASTYRFFAGVGSEVAGRTPAQVDARARERADSSWSRSSGGGGAYIAPQTGGQRILSHRNASPTHGHVSDPAGQRIDVNGNVVPPESSAAHLPLGGG